MIRPEEQFEFPISAKKSVSISDKPFEFDSRAMKIRVKVAYRCLTLSKKPPLFSKSWLRARGVASFARSGGKDFRRFPKAFSGRNFNVFFRPKAGDLQKKKKKDFRRNPKAFSDGNHKFQPFFPATKSNFFLPKKYRGGQEINRGSKNENRGALPSLPPRWRRACYAPGVKKYYLLSPSSLVGKLSCNTDWTGLSPDSFYGLASFLLSFNQL